MNFIGLTDMKITNPDGSLAQCLTAASKRVDKRHHLVWNTGATPENGLVPNLAVASAIKACVPRQKATDLVSNRIRTPAGSAITPLRPGLRAALSLDVWSRDEVVWVDLEA